MGRNRKIMEIKNLLITTLLNEGFVLQTYDAYSTSSSYIKLDYGVCNTIRISDHPGKPELCYRYNVILGGEHTFEEEDYMRYYFNENCLQELIEMIRFDRMSKIQKYGRTRYQNFMERNRNDNSGNKGFWQKAKLIMPQNGGRNG